jgi:tetratricopeptide (TPR) repeat protein
VNRALKMAHWRLPIGIAAILALLHSSAFAQPGPPMPQEEPAPLGSEGLVEKGSDLDKAMRAGKWEQAEQLLVKQIEASPPSADLLKLLGRVFLADRRPLNAAIAFKKAEAIAPLDSQTRYELAIAYLSMNHSDWARPELERLAQADPGNLLYQYWLGRVDYDAGLYPSAAKRFEAIVEADDTFMKAFDNLGLCYEALNQPEQAISAYRKAIALNRTSKPPSFWPPLNLGTLLRTRGELTEAEALLREAIRYDASTAKAHYQLGMLLEQQDHLNEAVVALKHAAASDRDYAEPHYALARIYRRQGKTDAATEAMATFQRLHDVKRTGSGDGTEPGGVQAPPPQSTGTPPPR